MMTRLTFICLISLAACRTTPELIYDVGINPRDPSSIQIDMQMEHAPRSVRIAMAVHPEYNDRYWRFIHDLRANGAGKCAALATDRENVWRLVSRAHCAEVGYRIDPAPENPTNRPVWHTSLRVDGGSINTMDTFLYLPDFPRAKVRILFSGSVPVVWGVPGSNSVGVASYGSESVASQEFDTDVETLLDSPILYGSSIRRWRFAIDGTPHTIAYWPLPNAVPFDTLGFVDAINKVTREAVALFGKPPYSSYVFMLEDGAWGALEHKNSVTIGMPSRDLARDPHMYLPELAHEFFHTWNLVRLYPEGRGRLSADPPEHSKGLWLSEGVTMYYAEALTRRAGFPERGLTRTDLLTEELESYFNSPGNFRISPELASERAVDSTGINGDYEPNYYTQGRLIGTALDLIISDSTAGRRGLDDLMRALYSEFAMKRGFTSGDVERTASAVCACDLHRFFDDHVRNPQALDFNKYLAIIGYSVVVDTIPAVDSAGARLPDLRIWAFTPRSGGHMRAMISDPSSVWAKSGLHTGTELVAFNGARIDSLPDFRRALRTVKLGDVVPIDIMRNGSPSRLSVTVGGYDRARVSIVEEPGITSAESERRRLWLNAAPD
ncbi:MAG: hypothetical protein ACRENK_15970 [Gemmatimonadaceae bacterium]